MAQLGAAARFVLLFVGLLCVSVVYGQTGMEAKPPFDHRHEAWDFLLKKSVVLNNENKSSVVRYNRIEFDERLLDQYLESLSAVPEPEFRAWTKAQQLAFLINAYNAFTVKLVLQHYPGLESIREIGGLTGGPWKRKFFTLLGEKRSLDNIEHDLIRAPGVYDEPRIHFAVNCASIGCPMLREEAYVPERLDRQLEDQAERFLSDRSRNRYDEKRNTLAVSKLFDWYADDFKRAAGSVKAYLARYAAQLGSTPAAQSAISQQRFELDFLPYDWRLNMAR